MPSSEDIVWKEIFVYLSDSVKTSIKLLEAGGSKDLAVAMLKDSLHNTNGWKTEFIEKDSPLVEPMI